MSSTSSYLTEIFSSIQGEGSLVGLRQVFLRFHGCNLACQYCDTVTAVSEAPPQCCRIERTPGRRDFVEKINPLSLGYLLELLRGWKNGWPNVHHSISLTGGEPLLHVDVLLEWLPHLRKILPIYLETNGVLHENLAKIVFHLDSIGMDIKLPSTSGHTGYWEEHRRFLQIAAQIEVFVKLVIGEQTQHWEIIKASEIIASVDKTIPLILQPVTGKDLDLGITPLQTLELQEIASDYLDQVRVIPQTHKFLGHI